MAANHGEEDTSMNFTIIFDRLKERSTWIWIVTMVTSITGVSVSDEISGAVVAAGVAIAGLVGVFTPDGKVKQ